MNLHDMINLGRDLLEEHYDNADNAIIGEPDDWSFEVREIKALGLCNIGTKTITISKLMMENAESYEIEDTLRHEVAHALAGIEFSSGKKRRIVHGRVWKKWARICGAKDTACSDVNEMSDSLKKAYSSKNMPKYYVIHKKDNGGHEIKATCNRRLKNLANRGYSSDKSTFGNLWLVETSKYSKYKDNARILDRLMFR